MHRHVWKIISKEEQPSTIETWRKTGQYVSGKGLYAHDLIGLSRKPIIVTYKCEKCGSEKVERK